MTDEEQGIEFFGDWGGAPITEPPSVKIPTPVGEICFMCDKPIQAGDTGHMMPNWRDRITYEPVHRECLLDNVLGPEWRARV